MPEEGPQRAVGTRCQEGAPGSRRIKGLPSMFVAKPQASALYYMAVRFEGLVTLPTDRDNPALLSVAPLP